MTSGSDAMEKEEKEKDSSLNSDAGVTPKSRKNRPRPSTKPPLSPPTGNASRPDVRATFRIDNTTVRRTFGGSYLRSISKPFASSTRSSAATSEPVDERSVEERRLYQKVKEAGEDAWGVDMVEVWLLESDASGRLLRPDGGYWRNPEMIKDEFLSRLEDSTNPMHIPAEPVLVGVDLPGHLWAEDDTEGGGLNLSGRGGGLFSRDNLSNSGRSGMIFGHLKGGRSRDSPNSSGRGGRIFGDGSVEAGNVFSALSQAMGAQSKHKSRPCDEESNGNATHESGPANNDKTKPQHRRMRSWSDCSKSRSFDPRGKMHLPKIFSPTTATDEENSSHRNDIRHNHHPKIVLNWRDIHSLVEDPDTPNTGRLILIHNAGFNYAAAAHFNSGGRRGIAIFLTQLDDDSEQLLDFANQRCMIRSAEAIGAMLASNEARKAAMAARPITSPEKIIPDVVYKEDPFESSTCVTVKRRVLTWMRKCLGGSLQVPPAMTYSQALWTFFGCLCGLLLLSGLSEVIHIRSEEELAFFMGPIGALMALQYALTAAPASQPRNAILGQILAGAISLSLTYIPDDVVRPWLRLALAPSIAIAMMGKCGFVHPPAGASAIILASGRYGWKHWGLLIASSVLSLFPAVFVNNLCMKRQYPTHSWQQTLSPCRM